MSRVVARTLGLLTGLGLIALLGIATPVPQAAAQQDKALIPVNARQLQELILSVQGHPVLFVLYASYCPACRQMFPRLIQLARTREMKDVALIALADDDTPEAAARYLATYDPPFVRYWYRPGQPGDLSRAMRGIGVPLGVEHSVPTFFLLDSSGGLVGRWVGYPGTEFLQDQLHTLAAHKSVPRQNQPAPSRPRVVNGVEIL